MINSIEIKNFLSHKKTKLEFSPGVNVIVGATDSGKSAVIRALRWAITNKPSGDSFRSYWGGDTQVDIEIDNDVVSRAKTDKVNLYQLNEQDFKAFGADVPPEIKKVLNLNITNVQTQFESHFLLSDSAGAVATHFNKVAHLDKIDIGLQNIQRWLKKLQQGIIYNESQVEELTERLNEYETLDDIEIVVSSLEDKEKEEIGLKKKIIDINEFGVGITYYIEDIERLEKITSKGVLVDKVLVITEQQEVVAVRMRSLERARLVLFKTERILNTLEELVLMEKAVNRALEIEQEIKEIGLQSFLRIVSQISMATKEITLENKHLQESSKQFHDEMDVCPLCETVLK